MSHTTTRTLCWKATWNPEQPDTGLEHVLVGEGHADSVLLAIDEGGEPFRLAYTLRWDERRVLRSADLTVHQRAEVRSLALRVRDDGRWVDAHGTHLPHLDGCVDIDIWPTPLTNSFPLWRSRLAVGQRAEFRMAWVSAPALTVEAKAQAYTRTGERTYRFESLDETGFKADLPVDDDGFVVDYPELFQRV